MKAIYVSTVQLFFILIATTNVHFVFAQDGEQWIDVRPSNTGLGGSVYLTVEADQCGNIWSGGHIPFFSEGAVARFDGDVWTAWSNIEGYIPNARAYDIAFDSQGGLWVACNANMNFNEHGGVAHYDGMNWEYWDHSNSPILEDYMRGIVVDHNDVVWATFYNVQNGDGGVAKFEGENWTVFTPQNSPLQSNVVDKIEVDAQNNVWIGSNMGLIKFDGLNWILHTVENSELSNNDVTDVEVDPLTNKLYVTVGGAIDIIDGELWSHINSQNAPISNNGLWSAFGRNDSLIITTVGGSYLTYIFDGSDWTSHPEGNHVYDCSIDENGNFWTAGIDAFERFDGQTWTRFNSFNIGMSSMFNNDIFVDSNNRMWYASSDNAGIGMFDCPHWESYNPYNSLVWPQPIEYSGLGTGICEDSYGNIWASISGSTGGVFKIDNGETQNPDAWHIFDNSNSGIALGWNNRMAGDQTGDVWVGYSLACSVSRYHDETETWENYNLYELGQISCGAGNEITSIRVDADNNVWICGWAGLARYDQENWTFYYSENSPMQQGVVNDIAFDQDGNKWIATEHGIYMFDDVNWIEYTPGNSGLIGENISAVLVDENNVIWAGTSDPIWPNPAGLVSFDGAEWTQYTVENSGLPEKWVHRMALDTLGNIWVLTTGHAAALFNPNGVIGYECFEKSVDLCEMPLSISEQIGSSEMALTVFPNPVSDYVQIDANGLSRVGSIQILNALGESEATMITTSLPAKVNVEMLPRGVHFVLIRELNSNVVLAATQFVKN